MYFSLSLYRNSDVIAHPTVYVLVESNSRVNTRSSCLCTSEIWRISESWNTTMSRWQGRLRLSERVIFWTSNRQLWTRYGTMMCMSERRACGRYWHNRSTSSKIVSQENGTWEGLLWLKGDGRVSEGAISTKLLLEKSWCALFLHPTLVCCLCEYTHFVVPAFSRFVKRGYS